MPRGLARRVAVGVFVALSFVPAPNSAQTPTTTTATSSRSYTNTRLSMTVVGAEIDLPFGQWEVTSIAPAGTLDQVFVVANATVEDSPGRRVLMSEVRNSVQTAPFPIQTLYPAIQVYARAHAGVGPATFADMGRGQFGYAIDALKDSPWPDDAGKKVTGPFFFLIPSTPIPARPVPGAVGPRTTPARVPLVLELRPYLDDGKHWVLFSDGSMERVAVDRTLLAKFNLSLTFVRKTEPPPVTAPLTKVRHTMVGLLKSSAATVATLTLADATTSRRLDVRWTLAGGQSDPQVMNEWATARMDEWRALADRVDAPTLRDWIVRAMELHSASAVRDPDFAQMLEQDRSFDVFSMLGGRAALRETLQTQRLRQQTAPTRFNAAAVPISTLKGVDVAGLPFDRLLAGKPGVRLALADAVPMDRLFIYFAKPSALFPFLDKGGDFLARGGSVFTSSAYDDDLKARYLRRLGLAETASRRFLESGEVTEVGLVASDLFFMDGTNLTLVMHVRSGDAVALALRTLGIVDLKADGVTDKTTASGHTASWARQGDLVFLSTSRKELDRMLQLGGPGAGESLGRSAEFRYMLSELPLKPESRAFVYFSDGFVRRMVSPALKIGQLRRMVASANMSTISAGALLYKLDGHKDKPTLARLVDLGYVPPTIPVQNYKLNDNLSVTHAEWGSLAELEPIETSAITTANADEAGAYQAYCDQYKQYWRQYFDPIAMRLDDAPGGALELSTFILPLADSQMYNGLRDVLQSKEKGAPLKVPAVSPEPVMQLSLNLSDESWVGLSGTLHQMFSEYTGISPAIFDVMGPGLHLAVQDSDPIITLGTTDLLGAFGTTTLGPGTGANLALSFALSVFTRPCKIMIELQDPKRAVEILRQATKTGLAHPQRRMTDGVIEFRQIEGRDAWVYMLGVPGLATFRLGVEVQNGYLVFTNIPWSQPMTLTSEARDLNGAAIRLAPGAVKQGLAGLFATQSEQDQKAALASMAALLPLLESGVSATPDEAVAAHAAIFGSKPLHPKNGAWMWKNGVLESSAYGSATHWKAPIYKPEMGDFGLFDGVSLVNLNMQFEQGGLRAVVRWIYKDGAAR
ncbi:MAG TPA: hypothetical protein VJN96_09005 [Vicinamibacterales bacterium]|nr:hypothetical protein [Vicinamibacterales bacterium]